MWIFGTIFILISLGTAYGYYNQKKKVDEMQATDTVTVEFLNSLAESMRTSVGDTSFRYFTEVKGRVVCEEPLVSELAGVECVYYSMTITRHYEEVYYEDDPQGGSRRQVRSSVETVAKNKRMVPFFVEDGSGQIRVEMDSAEIISESVLSRYEPAEEVADGFQIGSFRIDLSTMRQGGRLRTKGYQLEEEAIPLNSELYVLGEASANTTGALCLRKPAGKGKFIVSTKSEEELTRKKIATMRKFLIATVILAGIGIALVIARLIR